MGNVREPKRLGLGMEATKEGQNGCSGTFSCVEHLLGGIWILGINAPVSCEEGTKTGWVGRYREEIVPTNMNTAGFRDGYVNQVSGPGNGTESEKYGEMVV